MRRWFAQTLGLVLLLYISPCAIGQSLSVEICARSGDAAVPDQCVTVGDGTASDLNPLAGIIDVDNPLVVPGVAAKVRISELGLGAGQSPSLSIQRLPAANYSLLAVGPANVRITARSSTFGPLASAGVAKLTYQGAAGNQGLPESGIQFLANDASAAAMVGASAISLGNIAGPLIKEPGRDPFSGQGPLPRIDFGPLFGSQAVQPGITALSATLHVQLALDSYVGLDGAGVTVAVVPEPYGLLGLSLAGTTLMGWARAKRRR